PVFALPAPLIRDARSVIGQLQGEFHDLHYGFLLCVGPGSASTSHTLSQHQINEAYIEQKAIRVRKGRPAPPVIPRDEVRGGPKSPRLNIRHHGKHPQPKAGAGQGAMGGKGPSSQKKKGRRVVEEEGVYQRAEPLKPWAERGEDAPEGSSMRRRFLAAPRVAAGSRHQMPRRAS
ncbi:hypothetical protein P7C70_g476, partial [Phenoliferia sp. Uapishka_3]